MLGHEVRPESLGSLSLGGQKSEEQVGSSPGVGRGLLGEVVCLEAADIATGFDAKSSTDPGSTNSVLQ